MTSGASIKGPTAAQEGVDALRLNSSGRRKAMILGNTVGLNWRGARSKVNPTGITTKTARKSRVLCISYCSGFVVTARGGTSDSSV